MRNVALLAMLVICGCTTAKTVSLPSGQIGYVLECSGGLQDESDCMNKAAEVCGGPYTIVSQNERNSGSAAVTPTVVGGLFRRSMVVACGPN